MNVYLLSNRSDLEERCPFGVRYVSSEALRNPKTHLKFVVANSICIIDVMADIPLVNLPVSTDVVSIAPMLPEDPYNDKVIAVLTHLYPQHAASLRKAYMFGPESFSDYLESMSATYLWKDNINTYMGGAV